MYKNGTCLIPASNPHGSAAFRRKTEPELPLEVSLLGLTGHTVPHLSLSHALPSHHHPEVLLVTQEPS